MPVLTHSFEEILDLIRDANNEKLILPEFQRSFVWTNRDIKDFLVSLLSGYFVGTILLLTKGTNQFGFKIRYIEGKGGQPDINIAEKAILDGQQRLTALFYVLNTPPDITPKLATNPYRYFINIKEILDGKDMESDDVILDGKDIESDDDILDGKDIEWDDVLLFYSEKDRFFADFKKTIKEEGFTALLKKEEFKKTCFDEGIIPFASLSSDFNLFAWFDDYADYLEEKGEKQEKIKKTKKAMFLILEKFRKYKIPTLTLHGIPIYEVAEIFERINKTGVELSVFAIATAVFYKKDRNIREWWKEYYNENGLIKKFCEEDDENYPKYILKIMALLQGKEVKKKIIIDSEELTVNKEKWEEACKWLNESLKRLSNVPGGYGVINPNLLPYKTIIVTLSALLKDCKKAIHYKKIDSWYWSSVFTGRYSYSSDTVTKRDFEQVRKWIKSDGEKPDVNKDIDDHNSIENLDLEKTYTGALYKSLMNLIALNSPKDFFKDESIELLTLDDHHIFPTKADIPYTNKRKLNSILNRTLISDDTDKKILNKKPSKYLKMMQTEIGNVKIEKVKSVLSSHIMNDECYNALRSDDYERFWKERNRLIKKEMKKKCKISE